MGYNSQLSHNPKYEQKLKATNPINQITALNPLQVATLMPQIGRGIKASRGKKANTVMASRLQKHNHPSYKPVSHDSLS